MDKAKNGIAEIIKFGIRTEIEGQSFYGTLAQMAEGKSAILTSDAGFHWLKFLFRQRNIVDEANLDDHADLGYFCELC
jgi:hypothetical protein